MTGDRGNGIHVAIDKEQILGAIEVFARGFSYTRGFTHPYPARRIRSMWHLKDGPRTKGSYRREEWIAYGVTPRRIHQAGLKHSHHRYCVSAIYGTEESPEVLREQFKALGYRLGSTEALMIHDLKRIPRVANPVDVKRVRTRDLADRLNKAAGARQILPGHLGTDTPLRQYVALAEGEPVGWVRSNDTEAGTWCSNVYVKPSFRRRGIARALMCRMLRDDRKFGAQMSVLTASHAGANLYPLVGYRQIGTLMIYAPKRK